MNERTNERMNAILDCGKHICLYLLEKEE